jgi:hypothetical protein
LDEGIKYFAHVHIVLDTGSLIRIDAHSQLLTQTPNRIGCRSLLNL